MSSGIGNDEGRQNRPRSRNRDGEVETPEVARPSCREKPLNEEVMALVPQTDTGRRVEDTQANGRTLVKELGKLTPYVRKKGCHSDVVAVKWLC